MLDVIRNKQHIKGHTKIELFNPGGELAAVMEEDNMFSPAWVDPFSCQVYTTEKGGYNSSTISSPMLYLTLYNSESSEEQLLRCDGGLSLSYLGYAHLATGYTGTDTSRGSINPSETQYCCLNWATGKLTLKFVCDFIAGVATGTFNTISLAANLNPAYTISSLYKEKLPNTQTLWSLLNSSMRSYTKGDRIVVCPNYNKSNKFFILDQNFGVTAQVAMPSSSYFTILDLEPDNPDAVFVQESSSPRKVYRWNLLDNTFTEFASWTSTYDGTILRKVGDTTEVYLNTIGSDALSPHSSSPYVYKYNPATQAPETSSVGRIAAGASYYMYVVGSVMGADGQYHYVVPRSSGMHYHNSFEALLQSDMAQNYTSGGLGYGLLALSTTGPNGSIVAYGAGSAGPIKNRIVSPLITANRLSVPVTKEANQSLRVTYTIEMDA